MATEPHFEVFPERHELGAVDEAGTQLGLTGAFVWHFQDANGDITHVGGESFTRREDAHRSIHGVGLDFAAMFGFTHDLATVVVRGLLIVDLDAAGKPIAEE